VSDDPFSPAAIRVAVGLVALLVVAVAVAGIVLTSGDEPVTQAAPSTTQTGPVALVGVDAPDARTAPCTNLAKALPDTLPDSGKTLRRLEIAEPAPPAAAAWAGARGEPVVLRCGLPRPDELTPTAQLREVSGVRWLPLPGDGATTWVVVDRPVYVALTVPAGAGTGPLQEVTATIADTLAATPVRVRG
jgi:Protein of unknown function (DUF3515)